MHVRGKKLKRVRKNAEKEKMQEGGGDVNVFKVFLEAIYRCWKYWQGEENVVCQLFSLCFYEQERG